MLLHIARVIFILLEVLILFNLLIVVHELGHFLAARWRGLYIEKFGVWFGKPLWKKTINGVQYSLGSLPFGGFVALPQLAPMDIIEGKADLDRAKLPRISALDKIIVAIAGPIFSLLLALCFAGIVWAVGHPVSEADSTTVIGYVVAGSPADKAGLQPGDKIVAVDGKPVRRFLGMSDSVSWDVVRSEGKEIAVKFQRGGKVQTVWVEPYKAETRGWRRQSIRQLLVYPKETAIIEKVEPPSGVRRIATWVGKRLDLHCSAVGKALIAYLPEEKLLSLVGEHRLARYNDNTLTSFRRAVCAPAISFVDLTKHPSTTRSLCSSTLANIQTKS